MMIKYITKYNTKNRFIVNIPRKFFCLLGNLNIESLAFMQVSQQNKRGILTCSKTFDWIVSVVKVLVQADISIKFLCGLSLFI